MITPKIKNLFEFVNFLHSIINEFDTPKAVRLQISKMNELKKKNNFETKLIDREIKAVIIKNITPIENLILKIYNKAIELNICDPNKSQTIWDWNIVEIEKLKKDFTVDDICEILYPKIQYIELKTAIFALKYFDELFFADLEEVLNEIFGYFDTNTQDEYEPLKNSFDSYFSSCYTYYSKNKMIDFIKESKPKDIAHLIILLDIKYTLFIPKPRTKLYNAIKKECDVTFTNKSINDYLVTYIRCKDNTNTKDEDIYAKIKRIDTRQKIDIPFLEMIKNKLNS